MRQGDNDTVVGERTAKQMRWYWNALMRVEREKELFRRDLLETMRRFRSKRMRGGVCGDGGEEMDGGGGGGHGCEGEGPVVRGREGRVGCG